MPDAVIGLLQLLDLQWVVDQVSEGNAEPFLWWTVAVFAIGCLVGYATSYARMRHRMKSPVKFLYMRGLTKGLAQAMLAALDAGSMIPMGEHDKDIMAVHDAGLGVFDYSDEWDYVGSGSFYQLENSWRRYLSLPWRRKRLEKIAGR